MPGKSGAAIKKTLQTVFEGMILSHFQKYAVKILVWREIPKDSF